MSQIITTNVAPQETTPNKDEKPVRKIGVWEIHETLGEGGFSKVKLGIHETTRERVALKLLKRSKLNMNSSTEKQVKREVEAMSKIQHRNVIQLKEVMWNAEYTKSNGKKQEIILVVLELATGGELFEFLAFTGCFEEAITRTYFHQLIAGVQTCHSKDVAHRDLKPENLLLDDKFVLKLADFGFSNTFSSSQALNFTECGTLGYMAPEMFKNKGYDPRKADIWACGVIVFIMLAGFPPFQKPNTTDWWFQKLQSNRHALFWQAHTRNAYFSESTKDFINKILQPDPAKRITIDDIKKHPWFNGTTISDSALTAELNRRKTEVDQAKAKEKLDKKRAAAAAAAQEAHSLAAETVRSLGEGHSEEDMPMAPPQMISGMVYFPQDNSVQATSSLSSLGGGGGMFGNNDMSMGFGPSAEAKKDAPPGVEYDEKASLSVASYTQILSTKPANVVSSRIASAFDNLGAASTVNDKEYKIRAKLLTARGPVQIRVQVFTDSKNKRSVAVFRRTQGDSMQYRTLFLELRQSLSDIVVYDTPKQEKEDVEMVAKEDIVKSAAAAPAPAPAASAAITS